MFNKILIGAIAALLVITSFGTSLVSAAPAADPGAPASAPDAPSDAPAAHTQVARKEVRAH